MTRLKKDYSGISCLHSGYVKKPSISVSWHFTGEDSVIYLHFPIDENGWHAGEGTNGTGNRSH
nr:hypothetical protein [Bacillus vallismortis]